MSDKPSDVTQKISLPVEAFTANAVTELDKLASELKGVGNDAQFLGGKLDSMNDTLAKLAASTKKTTDEVPKVHSLMESLSEGLTKTSFAFNEVSEAGERVFKIFEKGAELAHFSAELKNLEANIPVATLQRMQVATEGAVSKVDLMRFAMKALHGETNVSQQGLETLLTAANTLADKGFGDTAKNAETMMEVLRTGRIRELSQFGIKLVETGDKQKDVNAAFSKFIELGNEEVNVDPSLKAIERLQASTQDWINAFKAGMGDAIVWVAGALDTLSDQIAGVTSRLSRAEQLQRNAQINALARNTGVSQEEAARAAGFMGGILGPSIEQRYGSEIAADVTQGTARFTAQEDKDKTYKSGDAGMKQLMLGLGMMGDFRDNAPKAPGHMNDGAALDFLAKGWQKAIDESKFANILEAAVNKPFDMLGSMFRASTAEHDREIEVGANKLDDYIFGGGLRDTVRSGAVSLAKAGDSARFGIGQFFGGTPDDPAKKSKELEAQLKSNSLIGMNDTVNTLGAGVGSLTAGFNGMFDAIISGSGPAGEAFRKAIGGNMMALGKDAEGKALFELAMALFEPLESARHLSAAAAFGIAGGVLLAGGALLGGGGGHAAAGASRGGATTPAGGGWASVGSASSNGGGTTQIIVNVGSDFVGHPHELAVAIDTKVRAGLRSGYVKPPSGAVSFR